MGKVYIGISGWRYAPWRGVCYPPGLAQARELELAARALPSIEINGSSYALQRPHSYAAWYAATPPGFVFSHKGNRYLTHILRLRDVETPLASVFASGVFNLREKLGPFLWRFPPSFRYDADLVERFFSLLPHDTGQALELARRCHERMRAQRTRHRSDRPAAPRDGSAPRQLRRSVLHCCANTGWPWWWRTRLENGRIARTRRPISCICACMATRNCMPAAIPKKRCGAGPRA